MLLQDFALRYSQFYPILKLILESFSVQDFLQSKIGHVHVYLLLFQHTKHAHQFGEKDRLRAYQGDLQN